MKKSVTSFIAVMLIIIFLGVTAVTGVYIPGGWTMPFRNTATSDTSATDTSDTSSTDSSADKADNKADSTNASADTSADSASTDSADTTDSGLKAIIPSVLDTDNGIRLGLDLVGGSRIVYEAEIPDGYDTSNLSDDMNSVQKVIRQRLTDKGFTEATVSLSGDNRVTVEIPQITNPEEAVQTLGTTAQLTFLDADGKEWLTGSDIKKAYLRLRPPDRQRHVADTSTMLRCSSPPRASRSSLRRPRAIAARTDGTNMLCYRHGRPDHLRIRPFPRRSTTTAVLSPATFTRDSATELANLINAGQIPFSLKQVELRSVGPQLGADAMSSSLKAGLIGLVLVMLFMIIMYRIPGVVSCFALCFYMVIEALLFSLIRVNLSLPGIAGIILSIGMAVDANVIIFERIKEEMAAGKTVKSAIDSGFKRAFTAILDSNITTLIACGVLFFLGTGTIVGFATTLGIGVIVSMFTALTITHFLLRRMVDFHIRNPKAYGLREHKEEKKHFPILKNFKIFSGISVVLIVTGLVALILLPFGKNLFNLSIDFAGGTEMEFNMHTAVTQDIQTEISDLFKDATGVDASSVTSSGDGNEDVLIRSTSIDSEQRAAVIDKMLEKYSLADTDILNNNDVSASVGSDLQRSAFICSILAILLMLVYITFRFELTSGLAAICCLVHDLLVMLSVYVLLQIPLDSNFIAAALTILGYSINASIIVFDRVRENLRTARKEPFEVIGEKSIWQTMGRTINTTLTTLFTIGMVYILGVPSLKQFTLPLIVGILAGGWSSVMLSTGLWGFFRKKFRRRRKI